MNKSEFKIIKLKKIIKIKIIIPIIIIYILYSIISFVRPMVMKTIMDEGIMSNNLDLLFKLLMLLIGLILLEEATTILQTILYADLKNDIVLQLYEKAWNVILRAKLDYFLKTSPTEIVNKMSTDISSISCLVDSNLMYVLNYLFRIVSGIFGLFLINWKLSLLVLLAVPVKYLFISMFSQKEEILHSQQIKLSANTSSWMSDIIGGIREIKLWNLYETQKKNMSERQKKILDCEKKSKLIQSYNMSIDSGLQGLITAALYGLGGYLIYYNDLTIGSLTAFISYTNYVINPISLVFNMKLLYSQIKPSIFRYNELSRIENETEETDELQLRKWTESILFNNISFNYGEKKVLENINLHIQKGEKIAIIGENGSGKSTLIDLLLRFLVPCEGKILLDGVDIQKYNIDHYRNLFSVLNQEFYLFADDLESNILMGRTFDEKYLNDLIEKMKMKDLLSKLPNGYKSKLENRGENLSGGERQKIGLLRSIVKDSPILVLDEATSKIDNNYSEFIRSAILEYFPEKTIILISHKKEDLIGMDKVYQLYNFKLVRIK